MIDFQNKKVEVLLLQRAIPHYRVTLFNELSRSNLFSLTIAAGKHDDKTATGLAGENIQGLNIVPADVTILFKSLIFQKIISLKKYDVIITDISINLVSLPFYIVYAKLKGIKVIGWGKGIPQGEISKESSIKRGYKKIIASLCDGLLLYGEISKEYFSKMGIKNIPLIVAQNTIDTQFLIDNDTVLKEKSIWLRKEMGLSDFFIFGYFGKLTDRKGVHEIIQAFFLFKRRNRGNFVLIIAGSGPDHDNLQKMVETSEFRDSVVFLGKIPIGEEGVYINLFDGFLSYSQGGLGILEAMALSKLIISTPEKYPETELLINNENCILSDDFTIDSFSLALEKATLLGDFRNKLEKGALESVKSKATIRNMVNSFETIIFSVKN